MWPPQRFSLPARFSFTAPSKELAPAAGDSDGVTTAWWRLRAPTVTTYLSSCRTTAQTIPLPCRKGRLPDRRGGIGSTGPCRHGIVASVVTRNFFSTPALDEQVFFILNPEFIMVSLKSFLHYFSPARPAQPLSEAETANRGADSGLWWRSEYYARDRSYNSACGLAFAILRPWT